MMVDKVAVESDKRRVCAVPPELSSLVGDAVVVSIVTIYRLVEPRHAQRERRERTILFYLYR